MKKILLLASLGMMVQGVVASELPKEEQNFKSVASDPVPLTQDVGVKLSHPKPLSRHSGSLSGSDVRPVSPSQTSTPKGVVFTATTSPHSMARNSADAVSSDHSHDSSSNATKFVSFAIDATSDKAEVEGNLRAIEAGDFAEIEVKQNTKKNLRDDLARLAIEGKFRGTNTLMISPLIGDPFLPTITESNFPELRILSLKNITHHHLALLVTFLNETRLPKLEIINFFFRETSDLVEQVAYKQTSNIIAGTFCEALGRNLPANCKLEM